MSAISFKKINADKHAIEMKWLYVFSKYIFFTTLWTTSRLMHAFIPQEF